MTNGEWFRNLPDEELAEILEDNDFCNRLNLYCPGDEACCCDCIKDWLGKEHDEDMEDMKELKRYITNYRGDAVEVPNEGDEVFYVAQYKDDDSMRVECLLWEDAFNFLYNLRQGRIFTSYMAAEHHRQKCMTIAQMAWVESGCAENHDCDNWFSKTANKPPKGVDD